jgi:hypothetical protein
MVFSSRSLLAAACLSSISLAAGYSLRVWAEGAPTLKPLFYSGTLESAGKLASGAYTIVLTLFDAESAGKQLCISETTKAPVEAGRFRVEVSADCVAVMKKTPDVWAALKFAGPDGTPHELPDRTKIGAVPYALEAQHAVEAQHTLRADLATSATNAANAMEATHAKSADTATRAASADSATQATNCTNADKAKSLELHPHNAVLADNPGDGWFVQCFNNTGDVPWACALMANRWCSQHGYAGGWYVGESDGTNRLVNCIK